MDEEIKRPEPTDYLVAELEVHEIAWMKRLAERAGEDSPKFAGFILREYLSKEDMPAEIRAIRDAHEKSKA